MQAESGQAARQPGPGAASTAPAGATEGTAPAPAPGVAQANGGQPESAEEQRKQEDVLVDRCAGRLLLCVHPALCSRSSVSLGLLVAPVFREDKIHCANRYYLHGCTLV